MQARVLALELRHALADWRREALASTSRGSHRAAVERSWAMLGPEPSDDELESLGFWAAAVLNPLPPLGLALEIRPAALEAGDTRERLSLALHACELSLDHLRRPPLWRELMQALGRVLVRRAWPSSFTLSVLVLLLAVWAALDGTAWWEGEWRPGISVVM